MYKNYAVKVTLVQGDGTTIERDYVRGRMRVSKQAFAAFALGDLIMLTESYNLLSMSVFEIDYFAAKKG